MDTFPVLGSQIQAGIDLLVPELESEAWASAMKCPQPWEAEGVDPWQVINAIAQGEIRRLQILRRCINPELTYDLTDDEMRFMRI